MPRDQVPYPVDVIDCAGGCGRRLRPPGSKAAEFSEKTYCYAAGRKCHACASGVATPPRKLRGEACVRCGRPWRPAGGKAADHPGTVLYFAQGVCRPCITAEGEPSGSKHAFRAPPNCIECGHPTRPRTRKAAERPGTRLHGSGGRCVNCARRHGKAAA